MDLTNLKPGHKAWIKDIASVSGQLKRRLIDMGVMEGTEITILRMLPFGGPVTIETGGQWIGIRRTDAKNIMLEME